MIIDPHPLPNFRTTQVATLRSSCLPCSARRKCNGCRESLFGAAQAGQCPSVAVSEPGESARNTILQGSGCTVLRGILTTV